LTKITERGAQNQVHPDRISRDEAMAVLRLRYWHHLLNEMLKQRQFKIPIHLAFGHEAAAVAVDRSMEPDDRLCLSHRNVAYNLTRTGSLDAVLEHYRLARRTEAGALMGSMNLAVAGTAITYSSSILGNNLAVACGIAMHRTLVGRPGVVFVLTGDGAMEEGAFWETLVFSRSHKLPLVIIVENNDYSMSSTIAERRCHVDLSLVCAGIGVDYFKASGARVDDTKAAVRAARTRAAARAPACVELELSTFCQHAGPTPGWPDDPLRISLDDGLLVEDSPDDPVFHVREALGADEFQRISDLVMKAEHFG
jgi:TPP-dependent pyruvate/acetoin dehydrogenase alpha subunit